MTLQNVEKLERRDDIFQMHAIHALSNTRRLWPLFSRQVRRARGGPEEGIQLPPSKAHRGK